MFHHLLPDIVHAEDPDRPYWPSSASSGIPFSSQIASSAAIAITGMSGMGASLSLRTAANIPRFMSEFGFQAYRRLKQSRPMPD